MVYSVGLQTFRLSAPGTRGKLRLTASSSYPVGCWRACSGGGSLGSRVLDKKYYFYHRIYTYTYTYIYIHVLYIYVCMYII